MMPLTLRLLLDAIRRLPLAACTSFCMHASQDGIPFAMHRPVGLAFIGAMHRTSCSLTTSRMTMQARKLPQSILEAKVRSTFAANEYPSSMQRLYEWSPDECIPEFYCDATVFTSTHPRMADLAVPSWAADAEDFIQRHR